MRYAASSAVGKTNSAGYSIADLHALEVPFVRTEYFGTNDSVDKLHYIRHAAAKVFAFELSAFHFGEHFVPGIRGPF